MKKNMERSKLGILNHFDHFGGKRLEKVQNEQN